MGERQPKGFTNGVAERGPGRVGKRQFPVVGVTVGSAETRRVRLGSRSPGLAPSSKLEALWEPPSTGRSSAGRTAKWRKYRRFGRGVVLDTARAEHAFV